MRTHARPTPHTPHEGHRDTCIRARLTRTALPAARRQLCVWVNGCRVLTRPSLQPISRLISRLISWPRSGATREVERIGTQIANSRDALRRAQAVSRMIRYATRLPRGTREDGTTGQKRQPPKIAAAVDPVTGVYQVCHVSPSGPFPLHPLLTIPWRHVVYQGFAIYELRSGDLSHGARTHTEDSRRLRGLPKLFNTQPPQTACSDKSRMPHSPRRMAVTLLVAWPLPSPLARPLPSLAATLPLPLISLLLALVSSPPQDAASTCTSPTYSICACSYHSAHAGHDTPSARSSSRCFRWASLTHAQHTPHSTISPPSPHNIPIISHHLPTISHHHPQSLTVTLPASLARPPPTAQVGR